MHLDFHTVSELSLTIRVRVHCCFTSTETVRTGTVREGGRSGEGAQDVHLVFHTAPER